MTDNVNNNRGDDAHLQTPDVNSQTPESADSKLADAIYGICLLQTYENDPMKTARNQTASIMLEIKKDRKALLANYEAMFQELVNCHGYERAKVIKEGIEAHEG